MKAEEIEAVASKLEIDAQWLLTNAGVRGCVTYDRTTLLGLAARLREAIREPAP